MSMPKKHKPSENMTEWKNTDLQKEGTPSILEKIRELNRMEDELKARYTVARRVNHAAWILGIPAKRLLQALRDHKLVVRASAVKLPPG
jgi:hypothetical protein